MGLISELRRRNVLRMAALYVVAAWLIMQVAEVVVTLGALPGWAGQALLVVLAVGLPIALVISWFYELTPEGVSLEKNVDRHESITHLTGRRMDFIVISLLCAAVLLFAYDKWSTVDHPVITEYRKLTESNVLLPPVPSILPLVVDKSRVYFTDFSDGDYAIRQVLRSGGEATQFELPGRGWEFVGIPTDITPDGNALLLWGHDEDLVDWGPDSLWTASIVGGGLRRIGEGRVGVYSPDGAKIVFLKGDDGLFLANSDMSNAKQIAMLPGRGYAPSFSPDGNRIRLTIFKGGDAFAATLWEVALDDGSPRQLLSDWSIDSLCCGSWTPDGRYFVFEARHGIRSQIYAVREAQGAAPFQLTAGAIDYVRPMLSEDGRTIFATGWQLRGEVMEFDPEARSLAPIAGLEKMSVDQLDYTVDGRWVTYVKYPEFTLWRKRVDADNALQLTFYPMSAAAPRWSPDGRSIAFTGWLPGEPHQVYTVPANGGDLELISNSEVYNWSPSWSPDGQKILFSEAGNDRPTVYDLVSGTTQTLGGTGRLFTPNWSPDGRYIVGQAGADLVLYEMRSSESRILAEDKMYESWYWAEDSQSLFVVDNFAWGSRRSVYRISVEDAVTHEFLPQVGREIGTFGNNGRWIGVTPGGKVMSLRNHSIHNIYALDWNPE